MLRTPITATAACGSTQAVRTSRRSRAYIRTGWPQDLGVAFEAHAQAQCDRDRVAVFGLNQADHAIPTKTIEREIDRLERGLGRITLAPELPAKGPADLEARPALGLPAAHSAHELPGAAVPRLPTGRIREVASGRRRAPCFARLRRGRACGRRRGIASPPASAHISAYASRSDSRNILSNSRSEATLA